MRFFLTAREKVICSRLNLDDHNFFHGGFWNQKLPLLLFPEMPHVFPQARPQWQKKLVENKAKKSALEFGSAFLKKVFGANALFANHATSSFTLLTSHSKRVKNFRSPNAPYSTFQEASIFSPYSCKMTTFFSGLT